MRIILEKHARSFEVISTHPQVLTSLKENVVLQNDAYNRVIFFLPLFSVSIIFFQTETERSMNDKLPSVGGWRRLTVSAACLVERFLYFAEASGTTKLSNWGGCHWTRFG